VEEDLSEITAMTVQTDHKSVDPWPTSTYGPCPSASYTLSHHVLDNEKGRPQTFGSSAWAP